MKLRRHFFALSVLLPLIAGAEVRETAPSSFFILAVVNSTATPQQVYVALTKRVSQWWDPAHTWSGASRNLSIDARPGGCFCESLPGGGVQHARVIFAKPGTMLRLEGALGPLQDMPVSGVLTFALAPDGSGTRITMSYRVAGALTMDAAKLAPLVDQVLGSQLERLRRYSSGIKHK